MRFSVWPNLMQPVEEVLEVARHAESTGWDGVWVADHFMGDGGGFGPAEAPTLEATAVLGALAAATDRVRIGPLVLGTTYRHPAVVANWAASVDHLSAHAGGEGRLVLGLGAGWQVNEHEQYGIDLPPIRDRVDRFAETCEVISSLLREPRTDFEGRWFHLTDALCEPKPIGHLPLLVGAKGDRMLGIAARWADHWNMWGLPVVIAERSAVLDAACERIGRDPAEIGRSTQALLLPTDDELAARRFVERVAPRAAVAGPAAVIEDVIAAWRDIGVSEVIVPDAPLGRGNERLDLLDQLATVFAGFRD